MPKLSNITSILKQSEIRAMTQRAVEAGGVNLSQGLCDLPTPQEVKDAAARAIQDDCNTYTLMNGVRKLREQVAAKLKSFNGISADPEREIMISSGATGAYVAALTALLNPGDRLLMFEPYYGYHLSAARLLGFEPVICPLEPGSWEIDIERLEKIAASGEIRAIVINTPNNPTGKVYDLAELDKIVHISNKYDLWIITDEIYEYITFDGNVHRSAAAVGDAFKRTVTISGFSKTFAMTGWRLGYASGPAEVIEKMSLISDQVYICAPHPLQAGLSEAIERLPESYYSNLPIKYEGKRKMLIDALRNGGFDPKPPAGSYFMLADYENRYGDIASLDAADCLLRDSKIAAVPASSFLTGDQDQRWLRFCFAVEDSELEKVSGLLS